MFCIYIYIYVYALLTITIILIIIIAIHPVSITMFPSFRTQPLESLSVDSNSNDSNDNIPYYYCYDYY